MRYIIYVGDKELYAKSLKEAILKAKTIRDTVGVEPKVLDTFCDSFVEY